MFDETKCEFCGKCLSKCNYIDVNGEKAGEELKKLYEDGNVEWLNDCITCFACNEYCPNGARPFDLIISRLEEKGTFLNEDQFEQVAEHFRAKSEPRPVELKSRVISLCVMKNIVPWTVGGEIFENEDLTVLRGLPYFCNVVFLHLGSESIIKERINKVIDNLAQSGAEEIIFFHEDCYALFTDMASKYGLDVPFKAVHLIEYLRDYLKENSDRVTKLNMNIAYQRPCASRFTPPEVEDILNEIFDMIGVNRVSREYDGVDALCCGTDIALPDMKLNLRKERLEPFRESNIKDAVDSGAEALVYQCPMCFRALHKNAASAGLNNYMVTDLCRLALGEELPEDKPL